MHKRVHLYHKKTRKNFLFKNKFILIIAFFAFSIILIFYLISKNVSPVIQEYASVEAQNIASYVINKSISSEIPNLLNLNDIFLIGKNNNNEINTVDFNTLIVNNVLTSVTSVVHEKLVELERGNIEVLGLYKDYYINFVNGKKGILFEVPSGVIFNNTILSNLGPKIPVKVDFVGDITSNIETKVTNYGINNALIEVGLHLKVTEKVILPISVSKVEVETVVPIAIKLIQGNIPNYYLNGLLESSSNLSFPMNN